MYLQLIADTIIMGLAFLANFMADPIVAFVCISNSLSIVIIFLAIRLHKHASLHLLGLCTWFLDKATLIVLERGGVRPTFCRQEGCGPT